MNLPLLAVIVSLGLFAGILLMIGIGRRIGKDRFESEGEAAGKGFGAVEAAIFGLLGLILAFSFSGGLARFDARRQLVIQEANTIGTAWLRLDLAPASAQPALRESFRRYLDTRIEAYAGAPDHEATQARLAKSSAIQKEIWSLATAAVATDGGLPTQMLLLPSLNAMFDTATSQQEVARMHPPVIIFVMLAALILACALFAGYDMGGRPRFHSLHAVAFAIVLSVTVYVIIDVEYPRLGLIRISDSDTVLVRLRASMD